MAAGVPISKAVCTRGGGVTSSTHGERGRDEHGRRPAISGRAAATRASSEARTCAGADGEHGHDTRRRSRARGHGTDTTRKRTHTASTARDGGAAASADGRAARNRSFGRVMKAEPILLFLKRIQICWQKSEEIGSSFHYNIIKNKT